MNHKLLSMLSPDSGHWVLESRNRMFSLSLFNDIHQSRTQDGARGSVEAAALRLKTLVLERSECVLSF
jgi:hypothetical protein